MYNDHHPPPSTRVGDNRSAKLRDNYTSLYYLRQPDAKQLSLRLLAQSGQPAVSAVTATQASAWHFCFIVELHQYPNCASVVCKRTVSGASQGAPQTDPFQRQLPPPLCVKGTSALPRPGRPLVPRPNRCRCGSAGHGRSPSPLCPVTHLRGVLRSRCCSSPSSSSSSVSESGL